MHWLGIDIGGTGIKAALVDERGVVVGHAHTPTRAAEGARAVLDRATGLAGGLLKLPGPPPVGCGVGAPGRIDYRRGQVIFAGSHIPQWSGQHLRSELEGRLGLPVHVDNDVNAAALAEGWIGAGRGTPDFVMVALGTGVGGAVVIGGRLWRGARSGAGEVGHMLLYPGGRPCSCGGSGCAEQYVSSKALTRRANEALAGGDPFRSIREVIGAAMRGQPVRAEAARAGVRGFVADLAVHLVSLQQAFDPQLLIIGGGIVRLGYWWEQLMEAVAAEGRARSLSIRLKRAACGPQAGVVGAARLAMQALPRPRKAAACNAAEGR